MYLLIVVVHALQVVNAGDIITGLKKEVTVLTQMGFAQRNVHVDVVMEGRMFIWNAIAAGFHEVSLVDHR